MAPAPAAHSPTLQVGYFQSKQFLLNTIGFSDSTPAHVTASFGAALSAMAIGSPFDVLGTRLMQKEAVAEGKGVVAFTTDMLRTEGIRGFYKGGAVNLARLWGFVSAGRMYCAPPAPALPLPVASFP